MPTMMRVNPEPPLLSDAALREATESQIVDAIADLQAEQQRRALENGDPEAIAEEAFAGAGFDMRSHPVTPYLTQGMLVCPGMKTERSRTSHDCIFVSVDDRWSWEHPDAMFDDVRQQPGTKIVRRAVTVLPAFEGMTFDVVTSKASNGPCKMRSVRSFEISGGVVRPTATRNVDRSEQR